MIRLASSFGEKPVNVAQGSTLMVRLEGGISGRAPTEIPLPAFEDQAPVTVRDVWETFQRAAADSRIKAVIVEPRGLTIGWARLEEIRSEIQQFKKSGKPVYAYLRSPGGREYYI